MTFAETHPDEADAVGAENEASEDADKLPAAPAEDDSAAGDTDQHSSSDS
jgi:hypothetical protein